MLKIYDTKKNTNFISNIIFRSFFLFWFSIQSSHSQVTSLNLDIDFVSNYLHRGISKSSNKPAIQFDIKYNIPRSNINIGLWKSNINHYGLSSEYRYIHSIIPQSLILLITLLVTLTMILKIVFTHPQELILKANFLNFDFDYAHTIIGDQFNINNSENSKYFQITSTVPLNFNYKFFTRYGMNLFSGDDNDKYNYQNLTYGVSKNIYFFETEFSYNKNIFKNSDYKPEDISSDVFMLKIKTKLSNENKIGLRK